MGAGKLTMMRLHEREMRDKRFPKLLYIAGDPYQVQADIWS